MKKSLLKNFFLKLSLSLFLFLLFSCKTIYAQGVGVHHYNLGDIEQIKAEMAAGMPVTFWATPGDGNLINELNEYNKSLPQPVQLTLEDPEGGYLNTVEERIDRGKSWVATLGGISESPVPLALMTSNEDETWRCNPGDQACFNDVAHLLADSNISLYNTAIEAGAAGKFVFASPMLNITHPDYFTVVALINQAYAESSQKIPGITPEKFPDLFGVWLLNEYVTIKPDGSYYLPEWQSAWGYDKWGQMPFFAKEFGVRTDAAGVTYDRGLIEKAIIEFFLPRWLENPNHLGGTILNLEGLVTPEFIDFLKNIQAGLQNRTGLLSGLPLSPEDYEKYKKYLEEALKKGILVKCPNGGYSRKLEDCKPKEKPKYTCSTTASAQKPTTFRPAPCESCSDILPPTSNSCATSFKVITEGEWCLDNIAPCKDDYAKTFNWKGDIVIDFTQTKVPFAGYGKADEIDTLENPATVKYLADYFDGSLLKSVEASRLNQEQLSMEVFLKGGIWRKFAPESLQDEYKLTMIGRAHRSQQFPDREKYPVRDYVVKSPDKKCPDRKLTEFIAKLGKKPILKNFKTYAEYYDALEKWEQKDNGCWKTLWSAIPMFSREDGVGQIFVQAQSPGKIPNSPYQATFPHLPRLYEVTQALQKLFLPQLSSRSLSEEENDTTALFASTENFSPANNQPVLLAQGGTSDPESGSPFIIDPLVELVPLGNDQYQVNAGVTFTRDSSLSYYEETDASHVGWNWQLVVDGKPYDIPGPADQGWFAGNQTYWNYYGGIQSASPVVTIPPGSQVSLSVSITKTTMYCGSERCEQNQYVWDPKGKVFAKVCTMGADGTFNETDCVVSAGIPLIPPGGEICQSPDSQKACFDPKALADENPNDPICVANSKNGVLYAGLTVNNYKTLISSSAVRALRAKYDKCISECGDEPGEKPCSSCDDCNSVELSREINIKTQIPWLDEIWKQTTGLDEEGKGVYGNGLFHIFTPTDMENWQPKQAKSKIAKYDFVSVAVDGASAPGGVNTNQGWLYYPKLGGVEEAKQCLTQYMLLPEELSKKRRQENPQEFSEICPPFKDLIAQ